MCELMIPVKSAYHIDNMGDFKKQAIDKFGKEEWRLVLLNNEFHGHIGIYSILGVKLGLYLRETMNTGQRNILSVRSFAGAKPPFSCLNDGIQVGSGITSGQGLFSVESTDQPKLYVECSDGVFRFRYSVKEPVVNQIAQEIQGAIHKYGGMTTEYWEYIRDLAMKCWMGLDRNEIFEIQNSTFL
jgi:formylmethanofuran dehydrogenase subunit E